jgi:predicted nuclease of predicted toxin-antitoxin system
VRILLDENLPRRLRRHFPGHLVRTVQQQGWGGVSNGELLRRAISSGFDILLTADQRLMYQQNAAALGIRVLVLVARRNKLEDLLPLLPAAQVAIRDARPGEIRVVRAP